MSFLATIRQAVTQEPFATAPAEGRASAGAVAPDAIADARAAGEAAGRRAVLDRLAAVISHPEVKATPALLESAVRLAMTTEMTGSEIAEFVVKNVLPGIRAKSPYALANRPGANEPDPFATAVGGFLPPTAADGWTEAMARAAGKADRRP